MAQKPEAEAESYVVDIVPLKSPEDNYSYFIIDPQTEECLVVDVCGDCHEAIIKRFYQLQKTYKNLKLVGILVTHHHYDHSGGNSDIIKEFENIKIYVGKNDAEKVDTTTDTVDNKTIIKLGKNKIQCYEAPCHTKGHILYYLTDSNDNNPSLFTGDTLFIGGCGKFFEGTAEEMLKNLELISSMPKETKIYCGHEYTVSNLNFCLWVQPDNDAIEKKLKWAKQQIKNEKPTVPSTIAEELEYNVFMRTKILKKEKETQDETLARLRELKNKKANQKL